MLKGSLLPRFERGFGGSAYEVPSQTPYQRRSLFFSGSECADLRHYHGSATCVARSGTLGAGFAPLMLSAHVHDRLERTRVGLGERGNPFVFELLQHVGEIEALDEHAR